MRILVTARYPEKILFELKENLGEVINKPWKNNNHAYNKEGVLNLFYETELQALTTVTF